MTELQDAGHDPLIKELIDARDRSAVLKLKLMDFRSTSPDVCVFAFEGIDDKVVYFHWIRRIAPDLIYEPFVCQGKNQVLKLKAMLDRDLSGLGRRVYFFVDRDFDELPGHDHSASIFMTETYSVENVLVDEVVLEELLKNELHCHAEADCRQAVIALFGLVYQQFLEVTKETNFRLYLARHCAIAQRSDLPNRIGQIANVELKEVGAGTMLLDVQIQLEREPTTTEQELCKPEFAALDPRKRYRGKFALLFFKRWLDLLVRDRNSNVSILFPHLQGDGFKATMSVLDSMAARASIPTGLSNFIRPIALANQ